MTSVSERSKANDRILFEILLCIYLYIYIPPHSACCLSTSGVCALVGGRKKITSTSCNGWHHHRCKECLRQWLKEKRYQHKLQPMTTSICASGVLALIDRITPLAQGAKVRAQGAKVRTEGAKVRTSISASQ